MSATPGRPQASSHRSARHQGTPVSATTAAVPAGTSGHAWVGHRGAELLISFVAGFIFAAGLTLSGMTQPDKVIGFLDVKEMFIGTFPGLWDPSLGFVMAGAVLITLIGFAATPYASIKPWFSSAFVLPTREVVDVRLVAGAVIFGMGWGLSGYCPGPALASLLTGQLDVAVFVLAMLPGMWLARKI